MLAEAMIASVLQLTTPGPYDCENVFNNYRDLRVLERYVKDETQYREETSRHAVDGAGNRVRFCRHQSYIYKLGGFFSIKQF